MLVLFLNNLYVFPFNEIVMIEHDKTDLLSPLKIDIEIFKAVLEQLS